MLAGRRVAVSVLAFVAGLVGGCLDPREYVCIGDEQCLLEGRVGRCLEAHCAYQDDACQSKLRWGPTAGSLAHACVPASEAGTGSASGGSTSGGGPGGPGSSVGSAGSAGSATSGQSCASGCNDPPSACWVFPGTCDQATDTCTYAPRPKGTMCTDDTNPCFGLGMCDGAGTCTGGNGGCDQPPGPCYEAMGTCDAQSGSCTYAPLDAGKTCDDGDGCTMGDTCDGAGTCTPGDMCPTTNPCEQGTCTNGACDYPAQPDGTSCGPQPKNRCCGGTCVDISSDTANCGGCNTACASGQSCESVAATSTCELAPANTTGRCTCPAANAACPHGQVCRTYTPYTNRCTPDAQANCTSTFVSVNFCPNYCEY